MVEACSHPEVVDGLCVQCGACTHEVILNGACYFCGATGVQVTVRPVDESSRDQLVPADRLRSRRSGQ
jgi:hypothetical protein